MLVRNHLLFDEQGNQVPFVSTPNVGGGPNGGRIRPIYLVIHYTAGGSSSGSIAWFQNPQAEASAHIVIGRKGDVIQLVPFNRRAWHAGVSRWGELTGLNDYAVGIELDNEGLLNRRADGHWYFKDSKVSAEQVVIAPHKLDRDKIERGWKSYPEPQVEACLRVSKALHSSYTFIDILGHDDISYPRKTDPGPAFPMNSFRSRVLGRA